MKTNLSTKKIALAGVFTALAVVGSFISFPVAGSKCAPVQHMVNILAAVTLGPFWGIGIAFIASPSPQSSGSWKPHGFPWKYGWRTLLRSCLPFFP